MKNRQAKKLVNKYGTSWLYRTIEQIGALCIEYDETRIPLKWDNKNIRKWMKSRYARS